jgi:hypothetical protein
MRSLAIAALLVAAAACGRATADTSAAQGSRAFADVARVLQSPRCRNCHPAGDRPLQGDKGRAHAMNISRASVDAGLACSACHQQRNVESLGLFKGPPGAPDWALPPRDTPMVFEGLSVRALCEQLKDPARNGHKTLDQLLHHVAEDDLVLWGWNPGGKRTRPPLTHAAFVAAFRTWVGSGGAGPCCGRRARSSPRRRACAPRQNRTCSRPSCA